MKVGLVAKVSLLLVIFNASFARAQTSSRQVGIILERQIQVPAVTAFQLGQYLAAKIPALPAPRSADQWTAEAKRLRRHILQDIAFRGWPREWVEAPLKFQDLGPMQSGQGYSMRKLRFEIVPGFETTGILYEPEKTSGKAPAILNVNGHDPKGKAAEYKQKRCINFAKRGIFALSLEWPGFGELSEAENAHDFGAHLDLVGANALGLFYLAMRKGVDYLVEHPKVDPRRLGVTGLSGGGWQTIVLAALDERVAVAVEVAGFGSLQSNISRPIDTDEVEEDPTDLTDGQDYTHLAALRAPRPTLLIHNAEDTCCFRAALVKPYIYDGIRPFFELYGAEGAFAWHENRDPATHNYQLDNRQTAYRFFTQHFGLPIAEDEIPSGAEIKTYEELAVGVPQDNLTILGLARKLAGSIKREPAPTEPAVREAWAASERAKLREVIRYKAVRVKQAWRLANSKNKGLETVSYRFDFDNGLSATGVWLKAIESPADAPATIVLNDQGRKATAAGVSDRVNRGEQVLALDLLFTGDMAPEKPFLPTYALKLSTTGDRPLGLEAAQLLGAANWFRKATSNRRLRLESNGIRSEVVALVASAVEPVVFSELISREAMRSLGHLLDAPVAYRDAPDLFCFDLYKDFDLDRLASLAEPTRVTFKYLEGPAGTTH
jgi:dienelactone hydrolase